MRRVLLVCPEPLGRGQPAGIGIRFIEIARVLRDDGHRVLVLSPDAGEVEGCEAAGLSEENIAAHAASGDVAVVQGHVANAFFAHARPIPTVIDLYDPFIIENLHYYGERGAEVFQFDHLTLTTSLLHGDLFLCASEAQRLFYLGALLAVGRVHPIVFEHDPHFDTLLRIAPFGVHPPRALPPPDLESPAVLFGGIYDWYDPLLAIDAVAIARRSLPAMTLTFTLHPNPELTPQGKLAEAMEHVRRNRHQEFVRFEPWVAYSDRSAFFDRFSLSLLTFPQSIETDLSMRTRVYDYLWAGLPIVTSSAPGTDELVRRYGAGTIVESRAAETFASELVAIARDRATYDRMVAGSQQFVRDHQWARTLEPLRKFCRAPRIDTTKSTFAAAQSVVQRPPSILSRLRRRLAR